MRRVYENEANCVLDFYTTRSLLQALLRSYRYDQCGCVFEFCKRRLAKKKNDGICVQR